MEGKLYFVIALVAWLAMAMCLLFVSGCGRQGFYLRNPFSLKKAPGVILNPIEKSDIFYIPSGAVVEWDDCNDTDKTNDMYHEDCGNQPPGDTMYVEKDGCFVSEFYMREIDDARVEEVQR